MYLGILLVYVTSTTIYTNLFLINFFCILFYIEIGSFYEEKSLTRQFGETYINYKKNTKNTFLLLDRLVMVFNKYIDFFLSSSR